MLEAVGRRNARQSRSLSWQTLLVVGIRIAGLGLALAINIVLARLLGADGFGIFSFAVSVLLILKLAALFGLDAVLIREGAASRELDRPGHLKGLVLFAAVAIVALSSLVTVLVFAVIRLAASVDWAYGGTLAVALLALPPMALLAGASAALEADRRPLPGQIADSVARPLVFLLLIASAALLPARQLTPELTAGLQALAYAAATVPVLVQAHRRVLRPVWHVPARHERRTWMRVAAGFALISAAYIVTEQTDVLMLAAMTDPAAVGIYRAAARYAQLVPFALLASMLPLRPAISAAFTRGDRAALRRNTRAAAALALALGLPAALMFLLFAGPFMGIFGPDFERGASALRILVAGQVVNVAAGPVGVLLTMTGHEKRVAAAVGGSAVGNVILNLALIPRFGIEGAAIATAVSLILWNLVMVTWAVRHLGINPTLLGRGGG